MKWAVARSLVTSPVVFADGGRKVCLLAGYVTLFKKALQKFASCRNCGNHLRHISSKGNQAKMAPLKARQGNVSRTICLRHAKKTCTELRAIEARILQQHSLHLGRIEVGSHIYHKWSLLVDHLFRGVSVRVFWCVHECNCCVRTGPKEWHSCPEFDSANLNNASVKMPWILAHIWPPKVQFVWLVGALRTVLQHGGKRCILAQYGC